MTIAHPGQPIAPHDLWGAWNPDPVVIGGLLLAAWAYHRGYRRGPDRRRPVYFAGALAALGIALLSPVDRLATALASAHMVQHLLLVLVAAPLLALAAPGRTLVRGVPAPLRRGTARWRGRLRLTRPGTRWLRHPGMAWGLHVGALWTWHAAGPYGAALEHEPVHAVEHVSLLLTGALFWWVVVDSHRTGRPSAGGGVLLLFGTAMGSVFLSALLTFAETPWYAAYARTTRTWGLDPLADQQLAGVIMWIPGGVIYVVAALTLLVGWIQRSEPTSAHDDQGAPAQRLAGRR